MTDLLLAIDQGTSGCKLTVFDAEGQVVADRTKAYPSYYPKEGYVEQDCNEWWRVSVQGIKEIFHEYDIKPSDIKGIGVDGTSWACIPVDSNGRVLCPTMIWLDRRAIKEAQWMKDTIGEESLIALSGNPVDAAYITPKILWIKEHRPDIYNKTWKFLQSNAFIVYRLTGEVSQDYSQGYGFHFYDVKKGVFDGRMAERLGIALDKVAPLRYSHEIVGTVSEEAAKLTGLIKGTPVVAGGLDAACCTLGAGVIHQGQTQEQGGQAGGMSICLKKPQIHPKLILGCHVIPDKWLLQGGTTGGGGTLNWFNRELGYEEQILAEKAGNSPFEVMSSEAEGISAGSDGVVFLPYMKGERSPLWNAKAKGVYYGLGFDKTRAHMIRSAMEGVAYSLKHNLDEAQGAGATVDKLTSVGGSANSDVWTQMKADVTGRIIEVPFADHATSLGAAILAGVGVGLYQNFEEAVSRTVKVRKRFLPNDANKAVYRKGYDTYRKLSQLMVASMW